VNFYREAAVALRQNGRSVLFYLVACMAIAAISTVVDLVVLAPAPDAAPDRFFSFVVILRSIGLVAISSIANTIFFARIGREMDKPNWRIADDADALRLFYRFWFLLGLLVLVYQQVLEPLLLRTEDQGAQIFLVCTLFLWATLLSVFGAFVMFYGRAARAELTQAFTTLGHNIVPIIAISLFGVLAGLFLISAHAGSVTIGRGATAMTSTDYAARFLVDMLIGAVDALVSCFIFAYAWLVCIFHRDHFEESRDDFDF